MGHTLENVDVQSVNTQLSAEQVERREASLSLSYLVNAIDIYIQQIHALLDMSQNVSDEESHVDSREWSQYMWLSRHVPSAAYGILQNYTYEHDDARKLTPLNDFYRKNMTRLVCFMDYLSSAQSICDNEEEDMIGKVTSAMDTVYAAADTWESRIANDIEEARWSTMPSILKDRFMGAGYDQKPYRDCKNTSCYRWYQQEKVFDPIEECITLENVSATGNIPDIMRAARSLYVKASLRMSSAPHVWTDHNHDRVLFALSNAEDQVSDVDYRYILAQLSVRLQHLTPRSFSVFATSPKTLESSLSYYL